MGRFVYQPVPTNMEEYSKHGQIIADIYNGHISTNHNNVIISATKRIEDKLEDVFQIENNIVEQTNVINNLNEDYYSLIENQYTNMLKDFDEIKMKVVITEGSITHLKNGIGTIEDTSNSILTRLVDAIHIMLNLYEKSSNDHRNLITEVNRLLATNDDDFRLLTLLINGKVEKCNLNEFIDRANLNISGQRADINVLKNNLLSAIG